MDIEDLARRVFQAEAKIMAEMGGTDPRTWDVALGYDDYMDLVTSEDARTLGWLEYEAANDELRFRGHRLRMSTRLQSGEIRIRLEVAA